MRLSVTVSKRAYAQTDQQLNDISSVYLCQVFDPPRNVSDVEDRHQRICLHAEVLTPAGSRVSQYVLG